ncbi:MAG: CHASE2 domain-containing protein, partial [Rhodospirillales bacterium]
MFRSIAPRELVSVFAIVVVATAMGVMLPRLLPTIKTGENWLQDFRFGTLAPAEPQNEDVVVVTITEDTLATLPYRSPVDRGFLADLLRSLEAAKPRAIGVDILFDQPTEPAKDAQLRRTLAELSVPVVIASAGRDDGLTESQVEHLGRFTEGLTTAPVNLIKDRADGTVRWIFSGKSVSGTWTPGFVPMLAKVIGLEVPRDDPPIVYRRGPDEGTPAFRTFPAHTAAVLPKDWFAGKIVFIGADLPLDDRHRTPFSAALGARAGNLPGVVIFAHAVAQLLDGRKPPTMGVPGVIALVVVAAAIGMVFAMIDLPLLAKGLCHLGALAALWVGGFALYQYAGVMAPLLAPTLGFAASASAGTA